MIAKWHKRVVAVTGIIGAGKSTVISLFASYGAFCLSADDLARRAVAKGSPGLNKLCQAFSSEILLPDGTLDRAKLGDIVFKQPAKRELLESITHPIIKELAATEFNQA